VIYARPAEAIEPVVLGYPTGLATVRVRVLDNEGATVYGPTTDGVSELVAGSGSYVALLDAPTTIGRYSIGWDTGVVSPETFTSEDLEVTANGRPALPPALSPGGPCSLWTTADAVSACCSDLAEDADLDYAIEVASTVLYGLSGRRFGGACSAVVRPMTRSRSCGPVWRGPDIWPAGCRRLGRVRLGGYPIREITQVRLDGVILDPAEYALLGRRYLVRATEGEVWPSCQYLEREATEEGTFEVSYLYGLDPPITGQHAAARLACEIAKACAGQACSLPKNVERVIRQGVQVATNLSRNGEGGSGGFGLPEVDLFLGSLPTTRRRAAIASPDSAPYPLVVSTEPAPEEGP
jgi:hypothetical protein